MTDQRIVTAPDRETVERLSAAFNRSFETLDDEDGVFADDVFCDLLPPFWRFQLQGREAYLAQLRAVGHGPVTSRILRVVPTATGFVVEYEESERGENAQVARHLALCEVRDGLITEVLGYCNGGWDDELRARHAVEAPMLREDPA
jgi:hypothetical protein